MGQNVNYLSDLTLAYDVNAKKDQAGACTIKLFMVVIYGFS
jgi:hypothetical protein